MKNKKTMKKAVLALVGIAVLAAGGYAVGQTLTKKKGKDNFVQLEDGRKMRISDAADGGGEFGREGERADVIGRIKSIDNGQMVVEKFEMGVGRGDDPTSDGNNPNTRTERPEPTISGEERLSFSEDTSFVKGSKRGMGRRGDGVESVGPEEISKGDLSEGSMVSVWLSDDGIAQRVMVR